MNGYVVLYGWQSICVITFQSIFFCSALFFLFIILFFILWMEHIHLSILIKKPISYGADKQIAFSFSIRIILCAPCTPCFIYITYSELLERKKKKKRINKFERCMQCTTVYPSWNCARSCFIYYSQTKEIHASCSRYTRKIYLGPNSRLDTTVVPFNSTQKLRNWARDHFISVLVNKMNCNNDKNELLSKIYDLWSLQSSVFNIIRG